jgi:hypothetical protein
MDNKPKAKLIGKVAKLPKNYDAVKFMENVKIPRNKLWYVLVEKQQDENPEELHMIKYNQEGVNVNQFVAELKSYYLTKFKDDKQLKSVIEKITVKGNEKFSIIQNIPTLEVGGEKLISKITKDLIKLLK